MDTDRELQYGPGMRAQRLTEAAFLVAAVFTQDVRFACVTFAFTLLQAMSPRWAPVALVVARLMPFRGEHRISDLYFDSGGVRGACVISAVVQAVGLGLIAEGRTTAGFMLLTLPTASFLIAPTLGFCAGCWFYVLGRDWLARRGWLKGSKHEPHDLAVDGEQPSHQPELRPQAQR
jgi:hypothetical protein